MKKSRINEFFLPVLFLVSFFLFLSCQSENSGKKPISDRKKQTVVPENNFRMDEPQRNSTVKPGNRLRLKFSLLKENIDFDSIRVTTGEYLLTVLNNRLDTSVVFPSVNPGNRRISYQVFLSDSLIANASVAINVLSDIEPEKLKYRIINTFPHDTKAFTQGFEYDNGYIYEGTGNYGESSLRKYELKTGEILKYRSLSSDLFGEGITRFDGKVYQITYRAQVGFVYDEENFELIRKIYYQNKEGWGLTNNGEDILMSDGTNIIYFMDPEFFSVIRKIEVYDNEGEVDMLNELELVNGRLYANRYLSDEIVVIDPESGKVTARIDMSGLLKKEDKQARTDVLNGIAYDKDNDRFFVTGKYWPKIFEVKFYN